MLKAPNDLELSQVSTLPTGWSALKDMSFTSELVCKLTEECNSVLKTVFGLDSLNGVYGQLFYAELGSHPCCTGLESLILPEGQC